MSNMRIYFNSLQIPYSIEDMNELQYYLASNRVIVLENKSMKEYLNSRLFVDSAGLIKLIRSEVEGITSLKEKQESQKKKTKQQARSAIHAKFIEGILNRMLLKIRAYCDEHDFTDEIKLR
jgi:hypothetical protein